MTSNSDMVKVGEWSDQSKFKSLPNRPDRIQPRTDFERNKTYIVTTIIEEPYIMPKKTKPGQLLEEKDKYIGYCKDLADILAKRLGIKCNYADNFRNIYRLFKSFYVSKRLYVLRFGLVICFFITSCPLTIKDRRLSTLRSALDSRAK